MKKYIFEFLFILFVIIIPVGLIIISTIINNKSLQIQDPNIGEKNAEIYGYKMGLNVVAAQCINTEGYKSKFDCDLYVRLPDTSLEVSKLTCDMSKCKPR